jgi:hypothetical protein
MNPWKPLSIVSTSALVLLIGYETASATSGDHTDKTIAGDYHRMEAALGGLRASRDHLMNSEHNHGGWRERAVESTDKAIHETEVALAWHP